MFGMNEAIKIYCRIPSLCEIQIIIPFKAENKGGEA